MFVSGHHFAFSHICTQISTLKQSSDTVLNKNPQDWHFYKPVIYKLSLALINPSPSPFPQYRGLLKGTNHIFLICVPPAPGVTAQVHTLKVFGS